MVVTIVSPPQYRHIKWSRWKMLPASERDKPGRFSILRAGYAMDLSFSRPESGPILEERLDGLANVLRIIVSLRNHHLDPLQVFALEIPRYRSEQY
jgi:hypothetical protein